MASAADPAQLVFGCALIFSKATYTVVVYRVRTAQPTLKKCTEEKGRMKNAVDRYSSIEIYRLFRSNGHLLYAVAFVAVFVGDLKVFSLKLVLLAVSAGVQASCRVCAIK